MKKKKGEKGRGKRGGRKKLRKLSASWNMVARENTGYPKKIFLYNDDPNGARVYTILLAEIQI